MIAGWDDAPLKALRIGPNPKVVQLIYPYYCNTDFLRFQIQSWWDISASLRGYVSLIVADDGSPEAKKAKHVLRQMTLPFPTRLFEIEVDLPWNWLAARNVAMHHAADGWCLATDMDHVVPRETLEMLIFGIHDERTIYRLQRKERTGAKIKPHPNSWFMTRDMFWKFGGYDETLSGHYGTDGDARRRWVKTAPVRTMIEHLVRHEHQGDSSTTAYQRKLPADAAAVKRLVAERSKNWTPKVMSFPYHEVPL